MKKLVLLFSVVLLFSLLTACFSEPFWQNAAIKQEQIEDSQTQQKEHERQPEQKEKSKQAKPLPAFSSFSYDIIQVEIKSSYQGKESIGKIEQVEKDIHFTIQTPEEDYKKVISKRNIAFMYKIGKLKDLTENFIDETAVDPFQYTITVTYEDQTTSSFTALIDLNEDFNYGKYAKLVDLYYDQCDELYQPVDKLFAENRQKESTVYTGEILSASYRFGNGGATDTDYKIIKENGNYVFYGNYFAFGDSWEGTPVQLTQEETETFLSCIKVSPETKETHPILLDFPAEYIDYQDEPVAGGAYSSTKIETSDNQSTTYLLISSYSSLSEKLWERAFTQEQLAEMW